MPTKRSNVVVSKSGCTSIRRPPGSTKASPQLGSCCFGDFLAANSTGTNRPAEESGLRLLFQRLFQMAIQRAKAQTSTLAKLAPPHTAVHKLSHQLLNLRSCTSLGR
jgi:hypothetical protein